MSITPRALVTMECLFVTICEGIFCEWSGRLEAGGDAGDAAGQAKVGQRKMQTAQMWMILERAPSSRLDKDVSTGHWAVG